MNRMGLGLAIGAGYLLGRTRKLKLACAVGSLVAGKKLNLTPKAVLDLANQQLRDNPQFKEIGEQLRHDLRGVGKAASDAMVERQLDAFADRLHGRTAEVRDQLAGVVPGSGGPDDDEEPAEQSEADREDSEEQDEDEGEDEREDEREDEGEDQPERKAPDRRAPDRKARERTERDRTAPDRTARDRTAPAKKAAARKASAGKPPAKKAPSKKAAQGRAAARKKAGQARSKGGGDR
ncbi:DNA primase [Streptomyces sp. NPDC090499]|uniref:DNA primase n=1 Tax=Streptomyces sp. NPDC090499 TaxID=3365965 RepID=UPI00382D3302